LTTAGVVVDEHGDEWFVAADVCSVLKIVKSSQAVGRLYADEKGACLVGTPGGTQKLLVVNEQGLNRLIFRSDKPEARALFDWIVREVMPALRKTGGYGVSKEMRA
jgi:prophage antirepressor-like protein